METYTLTATIKVKVEAFSFEDAIEAVHDAFDPGDCAGMEITDLKVK